MTNEHLGIVEERQRDRKLYGDYAYQAPADAARVHRIEVDLKTGERRVETTEITKPKPKSEPIRLEATAVPEPTPLEKAQAEIRSLRARLGHATRQLPVDGEPAPIRHSIQDVQLLFCAEFNATDTALGRKPYTIDDLNSARRNRADAWPRQVCVALVRDICRWASLPKIGKAFGGRDHTTIIHACRNLPRILRDDPVLAAVHASVLAAFEAPQ